jgi:hypothetical protein
VSTISGSRIEHWRETWNWHEFGVNVARLGVLFVSLMLYSWFRKTYFQQPADEAYANALEIIDWQRRLGIAVTRVELPMQQWVLDRSSLVDFFNFYYRNFKPALYISAIVCLILAPKDFRSIWRMFMIATLIALPWYAIYPLAPPRFMDSFGYPFVDTLAVFGGVQSTADGAGGANQFAAMPSMHIGWSTFAALWIAAALPRWRIGTVIGGLHLALMCVTVIVTGNHYVLDIVGGFTVAGSAMLIGWLLSSVAVRQWLQGRWRREHTHPTKAPSPARPRREAPHRTHGYD